VNARFSHRKPSSTWLVAGLVALLGLGAAAPARADDSTPSDPVIIVAPDPAPTGDATPPADSSAPVVVVVAPDPSTGTDSYSKGSDGTDSYSKGSDGTDSYSKGSDTTSTTAGSTPDSYSKG
jgi:hypothetical protein